MNETLKKEIKNPPLSYWLVADSWLTYSYGPQHHCSNPASSWRWQTGGKPLLNLIATMLPAKAIGAFRHSFTTCTGLRFAWTLNSYCQLSAFSLNWRLFLRVMPGYFYRRIANAAWGIAWPNRIRKAYSNRTPA